MAKKKTEKKQPEPVDTLATQEERKLQEKEALPETAIEINPSRIDEYALNATDVKNQVQRILEIQKQVMAIDVHYGTIPGTPKPTLFKAGAEVLRLAFGFEPIIVWVADKIEGWPLHKEYTVTTTLRHAPTGAIAGMGVGFCSSMEKKYRYRSSFKILDDPIPGDYRENKKVYAQKGFFCKKIENTWCWCESDGEGENPDIADVLNTVLKMAKKRSFVDAVLTATCASHVFTQDIEDMQGVIDVVIDQNGVQSSVAEVVEKAEEPPMPAASMDNILTQEARDLVLEAFKKMDILQAQLEQEVEVEIADWTEAHAAHFRALWSRVSDGHLLSTQIGAGLPE